MTSHQHTTNANDAAANHTAANDAPLRESVEAGRETRDVNIRGILYLAAATALGAGIIHVLLWWLFGVYENQAARQDPQLSPLFDAQRQPPEPRLQSKPTRDFAQFRQQQEELLSSYDWIDRQEKVVRIPVSRAMELLLERGLPEPTGPGTPEQEQPQQQERKQGEEENQN